MMMMSVRPSVTLVCVETAKQIIKLQVTSFVYRMMAEIKINNEKKLTHKRLNIAFIR